MRVLLHDTITGEPLRELEFTESSSWSTGVCRADEGTAILPGYTAESAGLANLIVPLKTSISMIRDDGICKAAGRVGIPEFGEDDDGDQTVSVAFKGPESLFEKRGVRPYPFGDLVDGAGFPATTFDTRITGVDYGTMMKRLYQQSMAHPGGSIPVVFEPDRVGTREKGWAAIDGKQVQDAVEDIAHLDGGVEWSWVPRVDENDRLSWALITGRDNAPEIVSPFWHSWTNAGTEPDIRKLAGKISPEFMASSVFFTGGKDQDRVLISHRYDSTLIDAGFPLVEVWDTSHSTVSEQTTLDGWAQSRLNDGQAPLNLWSFEVREERAVGLRSGDWCTLEVRNHWYIPDGEYSRRIVGVSGTAVEDWYGVTVAGMTGW